MLEESFLRVALKEEKTLYRVAKTMLSSEEDCQDAVQDALMKALSSAFRIKNEEYAKTYLIRILINCCHDVQRKNARHPHVELSEEMQNVLPCKNHRDAELRIIIENMDEKLKLPLMLHHLEGYSVQDIARMLRIPEGTVKRRLWNARKELREELMKEAL